MVLDAGFAGGGSAEGDGGVGGDRDSGLGEETNMRTDLIIERVGLSPASDGGSTRIVILPAGSAHSEVQRSHRSGVGAFLLRWIFSAILQLYLRDLRPHKHQRMRAKRHCGALRVAFITSNLGSQ